MNGHKIKRYGFLSILFLTVIIGVFFITKEVSTTSHKAEIGGFLIPRAGIPNTNVTNITCFPNDSECDTHNHDEIDFAGSFQILAPKNGWILYEDDSAESYFSAAHGGSCEGASNGANFMVIGHPPRVHRSAWIESTPEVLRYDYSSYTYLYHQEQNSHQVSQGTFVRVGDWIANAGNTGQIYGSSGLHLHMEHTTRYPTVDNNVRYFNCLPPISSFTRSPFVQFNNTDTIPIGFEEYENEWPVTTQSASYNRLNLGQDVQNMLSGNPNLRMCGENDDVQIYMHRDFGGECVAMVDTSIVTDIPSWMGVSSIYVSPEWDQTRDLFVYDGSNASGNVMGMFGSVSNFEDPSFANGEWNDDVKSLHNHYTGPTWLTEFSIADNPPLETTLHLKVVDEGDFDAMRICFNDANCQETSATEMYFDWQTYLEEEGPYEITVQYRRYSHNQNWANAEELSYAYQINHHAAFTSCGSPDAVMTLTSGVDCIGVKSGGKFPDLGTIGWSNKHDLVASVNAAANEAGWLSNGSFDQFENFTDSPRVVLPGETVNVGNDITSFKMLETVDPVGPVPDQPHSTDANTIRHYRLNGNLVDETGNYNGTLSGSATYNTAAFGQGLDGANPPDGSGAVFPAFDIGGAFTIEATVIRTANCNNYSRLLGQLGGNGNTGNNKWLIDITNGTLRFTLWHNTGSLTLSSYVDIPNDGSSHYLVITYDGFTSVLMYLDNVLVGSLNTGQPMASGATTFEIGMAEGIYSTECIIDEVRISDIIREPEVGQEIPPTPTPSPTATPAPTATPSAPPDLPTNWNAPENVSNSSYTSSRINVKMASDGTSHAVWSEDLNGNYDVFASSKPVGGSWSTPTNLSNDSQASYATDYDGVLTRDGCSTYYVWNNARGGYWDGRIRSTDGSVSLTTQSFVSTVGGSTYALDPSCNIHVTYHDDPKRIWHNVYTQGVGWGSPTQIATNKHMSDISIDELGNIFVSYLSHNVSPQTAYVRIKPSGGSWSSEVNVAQSSTYVHLATIASCGGEAMLMYTDNDPQRIKYAEYSGGLWSTPQVMPNGTGGHYAEGVYDSHCRLHTVFRGGTSPREVVYNTYANDVWTSQSLSASPDSINMPSVSVTDGGTAAIGYQNSDGDVYVSEVDGSTPPSPTTELVVDDFTTFLVHFDPDWGTSTITDEAGGPSGSKSSGSWVSNDMLGGAFDKAIQFSPPASQRGITFPARNLTCPYTIEGYARINGDGAILSMVPGNGNTGNYLIELKIVAGKFRFSTWTPPINANVIWGNETITSYSTRFFRITCDESNVINMYVDEVLQSSMTLPNDMLSGPTTLEIGSSAGNELFNGVLDEIRISNVVRLPGQNEMYQQ